MYRSVKLGCPVCGGLDHITIKIPADGKNIEAYSFMDSQWCNCRFTRREEDGLFAEAIRISSSENPDGQNGTHNHH